MREVGYVIEEGERKRFVEETILNAALASVLTVRELRDAQNQPMTSPEDLERILAPLLPQFDVIEPTAHDLRNTAKDLRALAAIPVEERKHRVWVESLRLRRA